MSVFKDLSGLTTDRLTFESVYCLNNAESFRIISLKWLQKIPSLFEGDKYNYHVIATNLECPLNEAIYNYNKRVNIENHIKELKNGFSLEQMPSGDFYANALNFAVGVLTYNTFIIMKNNLLPESFIDKTINTIIRWSIINIAGRVSRTARSVYLKLASTVDKLNIYKGIREKCVMLTQLL